MSVKIFVVSLARAVERRQFMQAQMRKLNLEYEFVDACDALGISDSELQSINKDATYGLPLTKGQVACARSHAAACRRLAQDGRHEYGLILEDDVIIGAQLSAVLDDLQRRGRASEVVLVYATPYKEVTFALGERLGPDHRLIYPESLQEVFGCVAYFLSRQKAGDFYGAIEPVRTIVDDWKGNLEKGVFSSLAVVFPFPVLHAEFVSVVREKSRVSGESLRTKLKNVIYLNRIFPLYQIILAVRRRRAEAVRKKNMVIPQLEFSKTYKLS